jgi:hypothetical protein
MCTARHRWNAVGSLRAKTRLRSGFVSLVFWTGVTRQVGVTFFSVERKRGSVIAVLFLLSPLVDLRTSVKRSLSSGQVRLSKIPSIRLPLLTWRNLAGLLVFFAEYQP